MDSTAIKKKAQQLIQRGAYDQAMVEYERLIEGPEADPGLYILVGDLSLRMGQRDLAIEHYGNAVQGYEDQGLVRNAIAVLKKILRLKPPETDAHRQLADLYARKGLLAESVTHYLDHASLRIDRGDTESAREVLEQVTVLATPNVRVALRIADLFVTVGDSARAIAELQRLAEELESQGRPEQAHKLIERAREIDPLGGSRPSPAQASGETPSPATDAAAHGDTGQAGASGWSIAGLVEDTEIAGPPADHQATTDEGAGSASDDVLPGLERSGSLFKPMASEAAAAEPPAPAAGMDDGVERFGEATAGLREALAGATDERESAEPRTPDTTWRDELRAHIAAGDREGAVAMLRELAQQAETAEDRPQAIALYERLWELRRQDRGLAERLAELQAPGKNMTEGAGWQVEVAELDLSAGRWDEARQGFERALAADPEQELARRRLERLAHLGDTPSDDKPEGEAAGKDEVGAAEESSAPETTMAADETEATDETMAAHETEATHETEAADETAAADETEPVRAGTATGDEQVDRILERFKEDVGAQLDAEDHGSHYDLALAYVEMCLDQEALAELEIAQEGPEYRQRSLELMATCYSHQGDPLRAAACLREALEDLDSDNPREADLRVRLGTLLMDAGDTEQARRVLREVVDRHPDHQDAQERLQALGGA